MRVSAGVRQAIRKNNQEWEEYSAIQDIIWFKPMSLWHFSSYANLLSIAKHGILEARSLIDRNISFKATDSRVISKDDSGISLTLNYPNTKMIFSKISSEKEVSKDEFVLFKISASVLERSSFLAFPTNSARFERLSDEEVAEFVGSNGLKKLFWNGQSMGDTNSVFVDRRELGLHDCTPTDPQAELLLLNSIQASDIMNIVVSSTQLQKLKIDAIQLLELFPNSTVTLQSSMNYHYWQRPDIKFWLPKRALNYSTLIESGHSCGCENCIHLY